MDANAPAQPAPMSIASAMASERNDRTSPWTRQEMIDIITKEHGSVMIRGVTYSSVDRLPPESVLHGGNVDMMAAAAADLERRAEQLAAEQARLRAEIDLHKKGMHPSQRGTPPPPPAATLPGFPVPNPGHTPPIEPTTSIQAPATPPVTGGIPPDLADAQRQALLSGAPDPESIPPLPPETGQLPGPPPASNANRPSRR